MDDLSDFANVLIKETQRVGIGEHESGCVWTH